MLFVDDDATIRATLPPVLESFGFKITSAESTRDAIRLIVNRQFDVLIADLNIDGKGDGFTIVSAMRSTHPKAVTFILSGYPEFDTALQAIRQQVDDYFVKPCDASQIAHAIKDRLHNKHRAPRLKLKRLADLVGQYRDPLVEAWLAEISNDLNFASIKLSASQRKGHLPGLLDQAAAVGKGSDITTDSHGAAVQHGETRAKQGYTIPLLLREARALRKVLGLFVQEHMFEIEVNYLVADMIRIYETIDLLAEESAQSFLQQESFATAEKRSA